MRKGKGQAGMTLLEVVMALSIFIIGITFVIQSDLLSFHYRAQREMRQQMLFYAAGQMEHYLEYGDINADVGAPFAFYVDKNVVPVQDMPGVGNHLEKVTITVSSNAANAPEPVVLTSYRVIP